MICPGCNGKGSFQLLGPRQTCDKCGGTGKLPASIGLTDADQPTDASQRPTVPARPDPNIMSPTAVDISTFQAWQKAKPYRGQACSVSYSPPGQSMQVVSGKYFEEIISRKGEVVGFEVLLPKHGRVESFLFEFIDKATV